MLSVAFLAALAALALPPALADWTFTLSPSLDESRCVTSAGLGNPVRILPSDGSEAQRWMSWEGCGSRFWQAATGEDNVLQAGYDWDRGWWAPRAGSPFVLNTTWARPDVGTTLVHRPDRADIENTYADQFAGAHQCLDWRGGRGETLQLWDCSGRVDGAVSDNQRWTVRYA